MAPLFFKLSETNGVWNHIYMLLPSISCQPVFMMDITNYMSYPTWDNNGYTYNENSNLHNNSGCLYTFCLSYFQKTPSGIN